MKVKKETLILVGAGAVAAYFIWTKIIGPILAPVTGAEALVSQTLTGVEGAASDLESGAGTIWNWLKYVAASAWSYVPGSDGAEATYD